MYKVPDKSWMLAQHFLSDLEMLSIANFEKH